MQINTGLTQVTESVQKMNDLLKNMANADMNLSSKMMKVSVVAKVEGLGENFDVQA